MIRVRNKFYNVEPKELKFTYELNKLASCTIRLSNNSQYSVAFKVMTTSPKKYAVKPNIEILLPRSTVAVEVTMRGPKEAISDIQCHDKFVIKFVLTSPDTTTENAWKLFKESGHDVERFELRVVYIFPSQASDSQISGASSSLNESIIKDANFNDSKVAYDMVTQVECKSGVHFGDLIKKVINLGFRVLVFWFLVMKILPRIWSMTFFIIMLVIKMINKLVSDSVEEWILKILCYVFVHYISSILPRNVSESSAMICKQMLDYVIVIVHKLQKNLG